jgi:hypothetical protein
MKVATLTSGNHFFVCLEGTSYAAGAPGSQDLGAGVSGRTNKPAAADPSWQYGGIVSSLSVEPQREEREVFAPSPGPLRLHDVIESKRQLNFTFTCEQMTRLVLVLLYGADPNLMGDAQVQFNPLEGKTVRAWVKIQQYDQNENQWLVTDVFAHLKIASAVTMGETVKADIVARTLNSALNTSTLVGSALT